ncbi:biopolymer transporter ExbD [Flavobacterium sp. MXW15]|uniref:Biopolymer transporter ExbD n=1 Tax=Xanthomonas chitinilytica TaxID=2989819 RepID=A0ABT3JX25_9XANT|nr:biopolymer transporter ExbD [Xanthomonas sp. H13-6]MCW4455785.1 biopolymer transporter ExbD [Flavobacterium sp. MXW15]MCW4473001.1 biopolymer transporter ExbD [Xanthomonas sp. H13-6]
MAFSTAGNSGPLADINVTPLVDVMLVLLIIFIVTAPIVARPITVQLPQPTDKIIDRPDPPPPIELRLDAANQMTWDGMPIAAAELRARLQTQAQAHAGNLPELRIATDPGAEYEGLAKILAAAEATGMQRIAFVRP